MIHRFCVSHTKPLLPESWYDDCISLGDYQSESLSHVRQLDQFWHDARPIAYGAAGAYVVPIAVERFSNNAELIEISSCRKRVLPTAAGVESKVYPTMRELSVKDFEAEASPSIFVPRPGHDFLVAQPLHFEISILGQYAISHYRRDLLDYTSLAIEMGILDSDSASDFLALKHFIPGGVELGIYPKSWLIPALSKIELLGRQFLNRYGDRLKRYNNYQIRAIGFLSERLGSFLLLRHLVEKYSNNIPYDIFGYMTVIVEHGSKYSQSFVDRPREDSTGIVKEAKRIQ